VIFTLSTLGCGVLLLLLPPSAVLARICSIGVPLPLALRAALSSPLIRSATTVSLGSSKQLSAAVRQTLDAPGLS
jgi:hypothetical protein